MSQQTATAVAHPNIAFIKYWGNRDENLRLPANGSLSMNLGDLATRTTVKFEASLDRDSLQVNGQAAAPDQLQRVSQFLDLVRQMAGIDTRASISSENDFPSGAGIASSSSAFAALALAASAAAGLQLDEPALSRLARRGSGSAARSIPAGFVEWAVGSDNADSYATSIAAADHWPLIDCIALVNESHKTVGSTQGHALAASSPLQSARLTGASQRLDLCRRAILTRDFAVLAEVIELDCHLMHAVMMTSQPPLHYWLPGSLAVMNGVRGWRASGRAVCYTLDAGPNVHVLCPASEAETVAASLADIPGVLRVLQSGPGAAAHLVT